MALYSLDVSWPMVCLMLFYVTSLREFYTVYGKEQIGQKSGMQFIMSVYFDATFLLKNWFCQAILFMQKSTILGTRNILKVLFT